MIIEAHHISIYVLFIVGDFSSTEVPLASDTSSRDGGKEDDSAGVSFHCTIFYPPTMMYEAKDIVMISAKRYHGDTSSCIVDASVDAFKRIQDPPTPNRQDFLCILWLP